MESIALLTVNQTLNILLDSFSMFQVVLTWQLPFESFRPLRYIWDLRVYISTTISMPPRTANYFKVHGLLGLYYKSFYPT